MCLRARVLMSHDVEHAVRRAHNGASQHRSHHCITTNNTQGDNVFNAALNKCAREIGWRSQSDTPTPALCACMHSAVHGENTSSVTVEAMHAQRTRHLPSLKAQAQNPSCKNSAAGTSTSDCNAMQGLMRRHQIVMHCKANVSSSATPDRVCYH